MRFFVRSQYSFDISKPIYFLSNSMAARAVVPLPMKGSKTIPFSGQKHCIKSYGILSGKL